MSDYPSEDDVLLGGGGSPIFKFEKMGDGVVGTISTFKVEQSTDIDGNLETWPDSRPKMQAVLTLATELRDRSIDDDDGERRLFVKGRMLQGLQQALRDAGLTRARDCVGGMVRIVWTGVGKPPKPRYNPPKLYTVEFQPSADPTNVDGSRTPPPLDQGPGRLPPEAGTPDPPAYGAADDDIPF